jgi:hypothetical protein
VSADAEGELRSGLRDTAVMINLLEEPMEVSLLADMLAPSPATSILVGKEGGPLFRTILAMPKDERNPLVAPAMQILCRRILLTGCLAASPGQRPSRLAGRARGL